MPLERLVFIRGVLRKNGAQPSPAKKGVKQSARNQALRLVNIVKLDF